MSGTPKRRGRPREFDPDVALDRASRTFVRLGYAGASLDALATAMDLNKPSLYAAFGDKHALYMLVLERRFRLVSERYRAAWERGATLEDSLRHIFEECIELTIGAKDDDEPPGCPIAAAQTTESLVDADVRAFTQRFRALTDKGLARFIATRAPNAKEPEALARLTNGILHDIALRARVGESRARLRDIGRSAATLLAAAAR